MGKPVIIANYPEQITPEKIHGFINSIKTTPIDEDYHFLWCPTVNADFNFEILSVKDIDEVTIEDLQKKLFALTENV